MADPFLALSEQFRMIWYQEVGIKNPPLAKNPLPQIAPQAKKVKNPPPRFRVFVLKKLRTPYQIGEFGVFGSGAREARGKISEFLHLKTAFWGNFSIVCVKNIKNPPPQIGSSWTPSTFGRKFP